METKRLGNIGEALTQAEFVMRGIPLYLPFGENEKSDMIIDLNGELKRVQCKTSEHFVDNKIEWKICSRTTSGCHKYTKKEVDYFALYNLESKIHILIPIEDIKGRTSLKVSVPYKKSKNQNDPINWENYTFDKILEIPRLDVNKESKPVR